MPVIARRMAGRIMVDDGCRCRYKDLYAAPLGTYLGMYQAVLMMTKISIYRFKFLNMMHVTYIH
jgi:hypothetical protein